jgi:hypothetical protein
MVRVVGLARMRGTRPLLYRVLQARHEPIRAQTPLTYDHTYVRHVYMQRVNLQLLVSTHNDHCMLHNVTSRLPRVAPVCGTGAF